jgi:hypothetical protein
MSLQQNVLQQIDCRKAEIRRAIALPKTGAFWLKWLYPLLESNGIPSDNGALVRFADTPEQGGSFCSGLWLTEANEFWEFTALFDREAGVLLEVESISNVTTTLSVSHSLPGIQRSFGALAIEVRSERSLG